MKNQKLIGSVLILVLVVSAVCLAQTKKEATPFEKYRQSSVNGLEFCKLKFEVASIRASLEPTPLPSGLGAPYIDGETAEGKLVIQVYVYGSDLPQTVDGRKDAMMQAVNVARAGFASGFESLDGIKSFNNWTVVQFCDEEKLVKARGSKPVDCYIGMYENGELVLY